MPTPPLPSRNDDELGAMPADCRVETLRAWLATNECVDHADMARAVRALVESKCVSAVIAYDAMANGDPKLDDVIARVLGGAS